LLETIFYSVKIYLTETSR